MTMRPAENPSRRVVGGAPLFLVDGRPYPSPENPAFPNDTSSAAALGYRMACPDEVVETVTPGTQRGARAWRITYRNTNPRHA